VGQARRRKVQAIFSTGGIGAVSRQNKVAQDGPGEKPPKCPAKRPAQYQVAALKLAQLRLTGETCGKRPAARRRRWTSRAKFFSSVLNLRAPRLPNR